MTLILESIPLPHSDYSDTTGHESGRRSWTSVILFATIFVAYTAIGSLLMLRYNIFESDSLSRVANAGFTMWSKDPHLSAIGFVWGPLPSLLEIPILTLSHWLPELKSQGLAGVIQSAAFSAGCALLIRRIAIDRSVGVGWQWVAIACFVLNPMMVIYGSSGMSESAMLFCILWAVRYLLRWLDEPRIFDLASVGMALGVGYLVRYETLLSALGIAALVAVVVARRTPWGERTESVALSAMIVLFPVAVAFTIFAIAGWIMTAEAFSIITSQYGNSNQVQVALQRGLPSVGADLPMLAHRIASMQPLTGIALAVAAAHALVVRRFDALIPAGSFGAVVVFAAWGQHNGATFGWFRYFVAAIPLVIVVALTMWSPTTQIPERWRLSNPWTGIGASMLAASALVGIPVTARSIFDPLINIGGPAIVGVASVLNPGAYPPDQQADRQGGLADRLLAKYLDGKNLPQGSVLMDTFLTSSVWLASEYPKQFVITSDYNFAAALNRPWESGIRYMVLTNPGTTAGTDAIAKRYPNLWDGGAGLGEAVYSVLGPDRAVRYQVVRLIEPPDQDDVPLLIPVGLPQPTQPR